MAQALGPNNFFLRRPGLQGVSRHYHRLVVKQTSGLLYPANPPGSRRTDNSSLARQAGSFPGRAQAGGLRYYLVVPASYARTAA